MANQQQPLILSYGTGQGLLRIRTFVVTTVAVPIVSLLVPPLLYVLIWLGLVPFMVIGSPPFGWMLRMIVILPLLCALLDIALLFYVKRRDGHARDIRWVNVATLWNISLAIVVVMVLYDDVF